MSKLLSSLILAVLVLSVLVACGGPTPTPQVLIVTSTFTPESVVQVVTATFTPTSEVVPSDTPVPEPTVTLASEPIQPIEPPPLEVAFETYEHPSGVFSVDIPTDSERSEDEDGLYFTHDESLVMITFTPVDEPLDSAGMESVITGILDDALIAQDLISSYRNLETKVSEDASAAGAQFGISSEDFGEGDGAIFLWQVDQTIYIMILLTPDYEEVADVWGTAVDTLSVSPPAPPEPEPPTDTPQPEPTNTTKPQPTNTTKPKPTNTPKPTSPPPPSAKKGCYLFENHIGAELNLTFTARDWDWTDSFKIPANGTKEYCLDPGRYTYTIDAPPPWGSTNGELDVKAGDRFRWPIRGN